MSHDYVRKDNLEEMIKEKRIIFDHDIIIGFRKYKKRVKLSDNHHAPKGTYIIYFMINPMGKYKRAVKVLNKFCKNKTVFYKYPKKKIEKYISNVFNICGFNEINIDKNPILIKRKERFEL